MKSDLTIPQIARMLSERAEDVAKYLFPNAKRECSEMVVGSIHGEEGNSLKVCIRGKKKGVWADFAAQIGGDLVDLWMRVHGNSKGEALKQIREYLNINEFTVPPPAAPVREKVEVVPEAMKPIHPRYHKEIMEKLHASNEALAYLTGCKRGLDIDTIKHFGLGLSKPFNRADGAEVADAVVAPMRFPDGSFSNRSAFITVPGFTKNPLDDAGWMRGMPTVYYSDAIKDQTTLFVCEGLKDVWRHWQAFKVMGYLDKVLLCTSTHGSAVPVEWQTPEFWARFKYVYLGQDNDKAGEMNALRAASHAGREVQRVAVPELFGKDWTDFWQKGGTSAEFLDLVRKAPGIKCFPEEQN